MLPIFNTYRAGNWTDSKIDEFFGPLKLANKFKWLIYSAPYVLAGILLLLVIFLTYRYRKIYLNKSNQNQNALLENERQDNENLMSL